MTAAEDWGRSHGQPRSSWRRRHRLRARGGVGDHRAAGDQAGDGDGDRFDADQIGG
jgi:hypothetical protein